MEIVEKIKKGRNPERKARVILELASKADWYKVSELDKNLGCKIGYGDLVEWYLEPLYNLGILEREEYPIKVYRLSRDIETMKQCIFAFDDNDDFIFKFMRTPYYKMQIPKLVEYFDQELQKGNEDVPPMDNFTKEFLSSILKYCSKMLEWILAGQNQEALMLLRTFYDEAQFGVEPGCRN